MTVDHALPPQTNGLVDRLHQMIMHMIGKLGEDKKANWPSHLAEIAHAYNAIWSAVTGYSPHYLMFGWQPRIPVDFVFPTFGSNEAPTKEASIMHVDECIASVLEDWGPPCRRHKPIQWQKHTDKNSTTTER